MIITNCGSHCSGKSVFSVSLANAILKKFPKATISIINLSTDVPAHAMWEPQRDDISKMSSIGCVFEEPLIDVKSIAKYATTHKQNNNIALFGYVLGDSPLLYPDADYNMVLNLLKSANQLSDYVIVDSCAELMSDQLAASIEMADSLNVLVTPNSQGVIYYKTFKLMYTSNSKYDAIVSKANVILSPVHKYNAAETFDNAFQINSFKLPYDSEIDVMAGQDEMFNIYSKAPKPYKRTIDTLVNNLHLRSE